MIPTHGEGWGRPQMEAMAMELPVISTNWSGLVAFLNEKSGYPIKVDGLVDVSAVRPPPQSVSACIFVRRSLPSSLSLRCTLSYLLSSPPSPAPPAPCSVMIRPSGTLPVKSGPSPLSRTSKSSCASWLHTGRPPGRRAGRQGGICRPTSRPRLWPGRREP